MNVLGFSGLDQAMRFKKRMYPSLSPREYRIAQGFDSAAALVTAEGIVAAVAEERLTREKTTGAFPVNAIQYCLRAGGLTPADVDYVAHGFAYEPYNEFFAATEEGRQQYQEVFSPDVQRRNLTRYFPDSGWAAKFVAVDHHLAHAASAFYPSGFSQALILVSDGMGEAHSMTAAVGDGADITVLRHVPALHSLGILYGVFTLYLGFNFGVDEYKVMGLAPYGDPREFYGTVSGLIHLRDDGTYSVPVLAQNVSALDKQTHRGVLGSLADLLGPPRAPGSDVTQRHKDIAAALQAAIQACQLHVLTHFQRQTGLERLCLAGGVALNCSLNGVISRRRLFKRVFTQPAAGDDGVALGAALHVQHSRDPHFTRRRMTLPLWGPAFDAAEMAAAASRHTGCVTQVVPGGDALCDDVAQRLAAGQIAGWFQGRMEYGPRALGSRSILADPRDPAMRDRINALVKRRESFRPFAPIVTSEAASTYFDIRPGEEEMYAHMNFVAPVRPQFRDLLPAVTHVDGSARLQTVSRDHSPLLWQLLKSFEALTGVPVLLNTSFNVKGQPIVCTPDEALDTFLLAQLDLLVMGNLIVTADPRTADDDRRDASMRVVLGVG